MIYVRGRLRNAQDLWTIVQNLWTIVQNPNGNDAGQSEIGREQLEMVAIQKKMVAAQTETDAEKCKSFGVTLKRAGHNRRWTRTSS